MEALQDMIFSARKRDDEKILEYAVGVKPIRIEAVERFKKMGGTIERVNSEVHAVLDGYKGREPYRDDLDYSTTEFLAIYRWATTRLNDKLYHDQ